MIDNEAFYKALEREWLAELGDDDESAPESPEAESED